LLINKKRKIVIGDDIGNGGSSAGRQEGYGKLFSLFFLAT
jgi:hypothetical protein